MEDEENEQRKNILKDDGTLALGIDFGTCRISSAIWNKNKKGTQIVKDPITKDIYFPAFISFNKEIDYGDDRENVGVDLLSKKEEEEEKKEEEGGLHPEGEVEVEEVENEDENTEEMKKEKKKEEEEKKEEEKKEEEKKEEGDKKQEEHHLYQIIKELKEYPSNPDNIVYNIKQILGQKYNSEYLQKIKSDLIFKIDEEVSKKNKNTNRPVLNLNNQKIPFEEIAS